MRKHLLAIIAVATAASATGAANGPTGEAELREAVASRVAGTPLKCLALRQIRSSHVIDGTAIVYEGPGSLVWVNRPVSGAGLLTDNDTLVITSRNGLLCETDPVDLIDRGSRQSNGFILLGEFVPYKKVTAPARN